MPMTTEQAMIGGRETFGEPKKLADIVLERDGGTVRGSFTRMGTTFVEVAGEIDVRGRTGSRANADELLPEVPALADREGLRRGSVACSRAAP